ncbi:MAG: cysteine desulfurase-like protein [Candidatus Brachytrichaceae bacterium NZ_4S206]|jgi:cysteine desulfurase family protein (TIGR01976 family)
MFNLSAIRNEFPALAREYAGRPLIFFDAPGGTQVTRRCLDYMIEYLTRHNANTHGAFITAQESDAIIEAAHEAAADLLNAERKEEIVFGQNMTSLTFALSRSIGRTLREGDEIILTRLDHDANFSPWRLMAEERGVRVHVVDIHPEDCTLVMEDFARYLNARTRLVAVGYVSNAVGTINPVKQIVGMAHAASALVFVDAVAAAPHLPIDVRDLDADFLACSTYKFWGPHQGILYGKYDLLDRLPAYKVRPADDRPPHKFETGTQSHENQAGLLGVIEYLEWLATQADVAPERSTNLRSPRAAEIHRAMHAVHVYETELVSYLIERVTAIPGVRFFGIRERERMNQRVPTIAIRYKDEHPRATAERLAQHGICVWDGNYYAINLTERLGVEASGGMVRIGLTHYNTREEIDRLLDVLEA